MVAPEKKPAPRNRTMLLTETEVAVYKKRLVHLQSPAKLADVLDQTVCQDAFEALRYLPEQSVDLLFTDPPYNLSKTFNGRKFQRSSADEYEAWLDAWLALTIRLLKPTASIYICGDWRS